MNEQTPNEPRDLVSQLRSRLWNSDVDERLGREAADAIEALRARPTLDRKKLVAAIISSDYPGWTAAPRPRPYSDLQVNRAAEKMAGKTADAVLALLSDAGQGTPEPEWTDPQPWVNPVTGARDEAEWDGVVGAPIYSPRTRAQYDSEQGT